MRRKPNNIDLHLAINNSHQKILLLKFAHVTSDKMLTVVRHNAFSGHILPINNAIGCRASLLKVESWSLKQADLRNLS